MSRVEQLLDAISDCCVIFKLKKKERDHIQILLRKLVWEVAKETELSLLRGEKRHLGEKHMLLTCVYTALSMSLRPVQREASFNQFKQALDTYLGIKLPKRTGKRQQRKLLPHL